jgi:C-terminal processing protease CtpA/Prc
MLRPDVAYIKLSSVKVDEVEQYINDAQGTVGMVIDIRNYPNEFVVFELGGHLVNTPQDFARFTMVDLNNPGAAVWDPRVMRQQPRLPYYDGRIAILVDEVTQSQAEYTTMAFRIAHDVVVIGSTTAGADGNVSDIPLPGNLRGLISGLGVFYPDKSPTQRIGIIPDIVVEPTIAGVSEGRDEVLDRAIEWIFSSD